MKIAPTVNPLAPDVGTRLGRDAGVLGTLLLLALGLAACAPAPTPIIAATSSRPGPGAYVPVAKAELGADVTLMKKLSVTAEVAEVSSFNLPHEWKGNIFDGDPDTFWHLKFPKEGPDAWIAVDLRTESRVDLMRLRPRQGHSDQLWDGSAASLQGSTTGSSWNYVSILRLDLEQIPSDGNAWISFAIDSKTSFRYYRLLVHDSRFLSLSELEFYVRS